jgi:hypothetical protein
MSAIRVVLVSLISVGLISCGSSAPPRKVKKKRKKTTETVVTPKTEETPAAPVAEESEKTTDAVKKAVSSVAKETTAKKPQPKPEPKAVAKPKAIPAPTFPDIPLSGRTYDEWYRDLCSNDVEKIKEACGAFQLADSRAKGAAPMLQKLTKHADAEVAKEAKAALAAVNK